MLNSFSFCTSVDMMYRYVSSNNNGVIMKYDFVGNLVEENIPMTPEIQARLKPVHCVMIVGLMNNSKAQVITANGECFDYNLTVSDVKALDMLQLFISKDIRFKTAREVVNNGRTFPTIMLCISETVDINTIMNKLPHIA